MGSEEIKEFQAFATRHRPRYTIEKPITPSKLIKAINEILEVDTGDVRQDEKIEEKVTSDELLKLIESTDADTLEKVKKMLKK